jgi:acetoin utilization protein AcuB
MSIESVSVSSIMTKNVRIENEDQNIQAICKIMNENNIGSVIIVKILDVDTTTTYKPVGIITERDVVRIIGQLQPSLLRIPVRDLMSKPLITLSPFNSIKDAIYTMQQNDITRIPIVEKENLEGIITDKDIFKAVINKQISIDNLISDSSLIGQVKVVFDQYREYLFSDNFLQR